MVSSKKSLAQNSASLKRQVKSKPAVDAHPLSVELYQFFTALFPAARAKPTLLLALSGGLDSMVLLHLLAELSTKLPFQLQAMHVHHGLSVNADRWAQFCQQQCRLLNIPLRSVQVQLNRNSGLGVEAEARELRYQALFAEPDIDFVATAHHQDDQAETLLLQLFRGAGVKGMASMSALDNARRLLRPLLQVSRCTLQAYAKQHTLQWCEDESNSNIEYERNFVRHEVLPVLESRFQSVKGVLARTAMHMAEADALLEVLAEQDAAPLLENNTLCLQGLAKLSMPRIKNVLRWWFGRHALNMPTADYLHEMIEQLFHAKKEADLNLPLQHLTLRKYQQRAYLCENKQADAFDLVWDGESSLSLPSGGRLVFNQVVGRGLKLKLGMTKLRITNRDGGERFKPNPLRPTRTLKYLLQEINMPPWKRQYLPLIYWEDKLACVPGVGIAYGLEASADEAGLEILWQE